jgi:hypothetical protein
MHNNEPFRHKHVSINLIWFVYLQSFITCYTSAGLSSTEIIQKDDERHESNSASNISHVSDMDTSHANDQSTELHTFDAEGIEAEGNESTKLLVSMGVPRRTTSAASVGVPRDSFCRSISEKLSSTGHANNNDIIELLSSDEENVVEQHNMQPKISTLLKKSTVKNNSSDVVELDSTDSFAKQLVSRSFYQREETKLVDMVNQLQKSKHLYDTTKAILPDKGIGLLRKHSNLSEGIEQLKKNLEKMQIDDNSIDDSAKAKIQRSFEILKMELPSNEPKIEPKIPKESKPMTWEDLKKITEQVQPKYTGVKGIQTFEMQKAQTMDRLKSLHGSMETMPNETELHANPKCLKINLMGHQKYGLSWMLWRERQQHPRGGILADDMVNCFIFNLRTNINCPSIIRG